MQTYPSSPDGKRQTEVARMQRALKLAAALFFALIVLIIIGANCGKLPNFLIAVYKFPQGDRVGHVVLFGFLAFLCVLAFPKAVTIPPMRGRLPVIAVAIGIFAALEEFSQSFFPKRTADPIDLACSVVGIVVGTLLATRQTKSR
jgi:ABC-type xylose transport system permease subunit